MTNYTIFTDSTADLTDELVKKFNLEVIPMIFNVGSDSYKHYPDFRELDRKTFYQRVTNGEVSKTTAIAPHTYLEELTPFLEKGQDILYLGFSSGMSSTYQSSLLAKNILQEQFPDRKIISIDSLCASAGLGLLCIMAARNKQANMSIEENAKWCEENKLKINHWYTPSDLFYLKRGGRVSATTAVIGSALRIKPVMNMDTTGHLTSYCNAHGRKQSLTMLVQEMKNRIEKPEEQTVIVAMADCDEERTFLINKINEMCPVKEILNTYVGPIIGAHTGPSQAEIFFYGQARTDKSNNES